MNYEEALRPMMSQIIKQDLTIDELTANNTRLQAEITNLAKYNVRVREERDVFETIAEEATKMVKELQLKVSENDRLKGKLNAILHPNGDGPKNPSFCDLVAYVRGDLAKLQKANHELKVSYVVQDPWNYVDEIEKLKMELLVTKVALVEQGDEMEELQERLKPK